LRGDLLKDLADDVNFANALKAKPAAEQAGLVGAWEVAFSDPNLRIVTGNLENISNHLSRNVHTADELKAAFDTAADKAKWIDDIGFNVLRKTDGKVEYINPNGRIIKWTEQNPNNFPNQISSAINSGDAGRIAEGEAAQAVLSQKPLEGLGLERKLDGQAAAELDIITADEIIEVKANISLAKDKFVFTNSNGTPGQIAKVKDTSIDKYANPRNKPVILYVKELLPINPSTGTYYPSDQAFIDDLLNTHNIEFSNSLPDLTSKLQ
jgi:hypothetical protein